MKNYYKKPNLDINEVIVGRLNLQTVQKLLHIHFGVKKPTLSYLSTADFISKFKGWELEKKDSFINLLGGSINYERTKYFMEKLGRNVLVYK